jgi:hypothetical protein
MVQCETKHESIDPKRRRNAPYYEGDASGPNQEQFRLPRLARHSLFWIEQFSPYLSPSTSLLPSQRCSNFQPDSANGVPKERHMAYIHGPPNSTSSGGGTALSKLPRSKRVLGGVLWRITYFWISVSRLRAFMISTNSYKSLLSLLLHSYSYNSQSPYLVKPQRKGMARWIGWFVG